MRGRAVHARITTPRSGRSASTARSRSSTCGRSAAAALGARDDVAYVLVFENRGAEVGATIPHPHGQIYSYAEVPPNPLGELARSAERCALCAEDPGDRLVSEADGWRAWVP